MYNTWDQRVEQEIKGKVLVDSNVFRTLGNPLSQLRRKLSGRPNYTMPIISKTRALSIDNNDLGSVIKVNLCYFELRKIISKVEFLHIIIVRNFENFVKNFGQNISKFRNKKFRNFVNFVI